MIGKLLISAIIIDILMLLTGGISGARQFLAYGALFVFFIQCLASSAPSASVVRRLLGSSIGAVIALGVLVAPVASCVRDLRSSPPGSSTSCEVMIGGQVFCREEP